MLTKRAKPETAATLASRAAAAREQAERCLAEAGEARRAAAVALADGEENAAAKHRAAATRLEAEASIARHLAEELDRRAGEAERAEMREAALAAHAEAVREAEQAATEIRKRWPKLLQELAALRRLEEGAAAAASRAHEALTRAAAASVELGDLAPISSPSSLLGWRQAYPLTAVASLPKLPE